MSIPYTPPGVTTVTQEVLSSIIPPGGSLTIPALVGEGRGYEETTDTKVFTSPTVSLNNRGAKLEDGDVMSVTKTTSFERVQNTNYSIEQTSPSNNTVTGDAITTVTMVAAPNAPTVDPVADGDLTGHYRYALVWYYGLDEANRPIESGIDEAKVSDIQLDGENVSLSDIGVDDEIPTTAAGTATGRILYRSKNIGSPLNPEWGPWYRIEVIDDLVTDTTSDDTSDNVAATRTVGRPGLSAGDSVYIQYRFADESYYEPTLFTSLNDVIAKYGSPFDSSGNVDSELSLAANLAYANGASVLVCVAVPDSDSLSSLNAALKKLEDERDVRIVALVNGSVDALTLLNAHVNLSNARKMYRVGLFGRDGVSEPVSMVALRDNARSVSNKAIQIYSPTIVKYRNTVSQTAGDLGGQYLAAAMAGFYAGVSPYETSTRRTIAGLSGIGEKRTINAMNVDAQNGLTVIEERNGILRVRHSVSTDRSGIETQEFNVTLAQHNMISDVIDVIDTSIIGRVMADDLASVKIVSAIGSVLDRKVSARIIESYRGLQANQVSGDPTTYNVQWSYTPTYYINNITINFSIDLTGGTIDVTNLVGSTGTIL